MASASTSKKETKLRPEEILAGFNQLRKEQALIGSKLDEIDLDISEHKMVIESLKTVDGSRKCFRLISSVLSERTVKEVLPEVEENKIRLEELHKKFKDQLLAKAQDMVDYKEKYNIRFRTDPDEREEETPQSPKEERGNVLVS